MLEQPISKAGWTRVTFGDVVRLSRARVAAPEAAGIERVVGLEHIEPGDLRIRRWGDVADGTTFTTLFKPGQILFGKRRAYQRKVAVADFEGVCSGDIYVLEPANERIMPELLPFLCQTDAFFDHAVGTSAGSLSPRTNWTSLASFEFLLPPIQEQARLVEALIAIQDSAESMLGLIEATRVAQIAAFEELLLRADAKPVSLGSIMTASPRNGYSPVAASRKTGHWVLALSAISKWGYRPEQFKPVEVGPETLGSRINKGDLVISRSNTRDLVGLPMVFPEDRSDVSYPDTMMRISVDPKTIGTSYLEMCLRSPKCRRQVQSFAAGTSSSMLKINGANVRKVSVPLVSVKQQAEILESISQFTAALAFAARRFDETRKLQMMIANDAFSGVVNA